MLTQSPSSNLFWPAMVFALNQAQPRTAQVRLRDAPGYILISATQPLSQAALLISSPSAQIPGFCWAVFSL